MTDKKSGGGVRSHVCPYCKGKERLPSLARALNLKECPACGGYGKVDEWYYNKFKNDLSGFWNRIFEWFESLKVKNEKQKE